MVTTIIKRDGREKPFHINKISNAIFKAAQALGGENRQMSEELAEVVMNVLNEKFPDQSPTVEEVQDTVEMVLIDSGHARTAKEYILYRAQRSKQREMQTSLMRTYHELTFKDASDNEIKRENANIDGDTAMGTMLKYGSEGAKQFYHMFMLDKKHSEAHLNGDIHIHDLDFLTLTTTCCQIDLDKLFTGGFSTGHGFLREPKEIQTYSAQACIAIQSNQNDQHGGQSIPNFDYAMAKGVAKSYIRIYLQNVAKIIELENILEDATLWVEENFRLIYDEKQLKPSLENDHEYMDAERNALLSITTPDKIDKIQSAAKKYATREIDKATNQAMKALIHNLNTMHSRAGAQIPFSSINYGMDTTPEGRMVIKNILLSTERGLGNGETPIFPIQIFKVKEGINYNPEDPNIDLFDLACKVSAKRLFPNFSFIDAPFNHKYYQPGKPETEVAYMGCRTRVMGNVYDPSKEIVYGRGNLSFTSINLPRLAIRAHQDIEFFFKLLEDELELVCQQLYDRYLIQAKKKVKNFPFLMGQGIWIDSDKLKYEDNIGEILKHGTLTAGFIGLAECLKALTGAHHGESETSQRLGLDIVGFMRRHMDSMAEKTKMNYSLIATPAEGLSGRFVKMDAKKFGVLDGITDRDYYTNSFHIPVHFPINAYDKIKLEAPYHALTNAGHITYVELDGDPVKNLDSYKTIIRCMKESGIGYGSINHPVDRDPVCGYTGIIDNCCPGCGRTEDDGDVKFDRIRRITGYLVGTLERFNSGKRAEEENRVKHDTNMEQI